MTRRSRTGRVPSDSPQIEREIVRMLWTFHVATTDQLTRLLWNTSTPALRQRTTIALRRLLQMCIVSREARRPLPGYRGHLHGRVSAGYYYGLTEIGRAWGGTAMPELQALHVVTREGSMTDPDRRTITHSAHCTEYCTRMIQYLRGHPLTVGMFFETESTVIGRHLRMDCLIRLRLHRRPPAASPADEERPPWHVPWLLTLRTPSVPATLDATFALEIDEGSENLAVLERKALNYRRTFIQGVPGEQRLVNAAGIDAELPVVQWQQVLCPVQVADQIEAQLAYFPIPLFVMNSEQRLANVWQAWSEGWPGAEVRMTTWAHLEQARSVMRAPYLNQQRQWVDLLGNPLAA